MMESNKKCKTREKELTKDKLQHLKDPPKKKKRRRKERKRMLAEQPEVEEMKVEHQPLANACHSVKKRTLELEPKKSLSRGRMVKILGK